MSIADIPTEQLSRADKIALMEKLWSELSSEEPPAWHDEVLSERSSEWDQRHFISQDWDEVRNQLGSRRK